MDQRRQTGHHWTRLSCRANEVRLQLSVLAYGQPRRLGLAANQKLVANEFATQVDEDRLVKHARYFAGGGASGHAAQDLGAAAAKRVALPGRGSTQGAVSAGAPFSPLVCERTDEPWRLPAEVMCRVQREKTWYSAQRGCIPVTVPGPKWKSWLSSHRGPYRTTPNERRWSMATTNILPELFNELRLSGFHGAGPAPRRASPADRSGNLASGTLHWRDPRTGRGACPAVARDVTRLAARDSTPSSSGEYRPLVGSEV